MIKQLLSGIILGIIISIVSLQHDPIIEKMIGDGFKQAFEQSLDCTMHCTIDHINLFFPAISLSDVTVLPSNNGNGWQWQAKNIS